MNRAIVEAGVIGTPIHYKGCFVTKVRLDLRDETL